MGSILEHERINFYSTIFRSPNIFLVKISIKTNQLGIFFIQLQLSEVIMRARKYMEQMGCKNGRDIAVMNEKKTVEDLKRYFGDNAKLPEVKHFLDNITKDKVG